MARESLDIPSPSSRSYVSVSRPSSAPPSARGVRGASFVSAQAPPPWRVTSSGGASPVPQTVHLDLGAGVRSTRPAVFRSTGRSYGDPSPRVLNEMMAAVESTSFPRSIRNPTFVNPRTMSSLVWTHKGLEVREDGVWVSRDLWRTVRTQLDLRTAEVAGLVEDAARAEAAHKLDMANLRSQASDLVDQLNAQDWAHRAAAAERERAAAGLRRDLEMASRALAGAREDAALAAEQHAAMVRSRDEACATNQRLAATADDLDFRLRLEAQRSSALTDRGSALEKEADFLRERRAGDQQRIDGLESRFREATAALKDARTQLAAKSEAHDRLLPPAMHAAEVISRLEADNARLVRLLERTSEGEELGRRAAAAKGMHYVPLIDCLLEQGTVTERYTSLDDRPVALDSELLYWVPTQVLECAYEYLQDRAARAAVGGGGGHGGGGATGDVAPPRVGGAGGGGHPPPTHGVLPSEAALAAAASASSSSARDERAALMAAVVRMNRVWAEQEESKLAEVAAATARLVRENEALKALSLRVPYKEVTQAAKIDYLRKEVHRLHGAGADAAHVQRALGAVRSEKARQQRVLERSLLALETLSGRLATEKGRVVALRDLRTHTLAVEVAAELAPTRGEMDGTVFGAHIGAARSDPPGGSAAATPGSSLAAGQAAGSSAGGVMSPNLGPASRVPRPISAAAATIGRDRAPQSPTFRLRRQLSARLMQPIGKIRGSQ